MAAILTVNNAPTITTPPANVTVCAPSGASFDVTATNALTYQWQVSPDGGVTWNNVVNGGVYGGATTATLNISNTTGLNGNQYRCVVGGGPSCAPAISVAAILTVNAAPVITTQPANTAICVPPAGSGTVGTSFNVTATNATSYQWQVSTDGGVTWNNIVNGGVYGGATTSTLTISDGTGLNGYEYRCIVDGNVPCGPTTSAAAILTVNNAPVITTPPASVTICTPLPGGVAVGTSFSATATNGVTYQWQVSTDGGVTWNNVTNGGIYSGATTTILSISDVTGLDGYQYRIMVGGGPSCAPAISVAAILPVHTAPEITTQPVDVAICVPPAGSGTVGTSFSVAATNATSYQWQVSTDGGVTWNNIVNGGIYGGATTSTLTISDGTGLNGYQYRCIVDGQTLCSPATSAAATLTVNNAPVITTPPANVTICAPSGASFTVVAANGLTYQWQVSTDAGVTWNNVVNGGVYSGATTATLNISNATGFNAYQYRVIVGGAALCAPETSVAAILTVNTAPAITSQPADATICVPPAGSGTVGTSFSVTATNAISYQWQVSTHGGATWNNVVNGGVYSGATSSTLIITDGTGFNGYQYRCIVDGAAPCASTTSDPAILTVNNAPVITQ